MNTFPHCGSIIIDKQIWNFVIGNKEYLKLIIGGYTFPIIKDKNNALKIQWTKYLFYTSYIPRRVREKIDNYIHKFGNLLVFT